MATSGGGGAPEVPQPRAPAPKHFSVRMAPATQQRWSEWMPGSSNRPASPHLLFDRIFGPDAPAECASKLADILNTHYMGGIAQRSPIVAAVAQGVVPPYGSVPPSDQPPAPPVSECVCGAGGAYLLREQQLQRDLAAALERAEQAERELVPLRAFHLQYSPAQRARSVLGMQQHGSNYTKRMATIHERMLETVRRLGCCDPMDWFKRWFAMRDGARELADIVQHTRVCGARTDKEQSVHEKLIENGRKMGMAAFRESLTADAYRTLYVNDVCDMSDRKHVVLLRVTGLQRVLGGRNAVAAARRVLNDVPCG